MAGLRHLLLVVLAITAGRRVQGFACSDEEKFKPCSCVEDRHLGYIIQCQDEPVTLADLDNLFSLLSDWKDPFYQLHIASESITNITNVFHGVSFREIMLINMDGLEFIAPDAFEDSSKVLKKFQLDGAAKYSAHDFPYNSFDDFENLVLVGLSSLENVNSLPLINASNIVLLLMEFEVGKSLPEGFMADAHIGSVTFMDTGLEEIPKHAFALGDGALNSLDLSYNSIDTFDAEAFVTSDPALFGLNLDDNQITTLNQSVFEGVFSAMLPQYTSEGEDVYSFIISGNPLACGCDMAWAFRTPKYQAVLQQSPGIVPATCASGKQIVHLTKEDFANCP